MRTRLVKTAGKAPVKPIERSEAILSQIADVDLFLAREIRKVLEVAPTIPPPTPMVPAYIPTRTSLTTS